MSDFDERGAVVVGGRSIAASSSPSVRTRVPQPWPSSALKTFIELGVVPVLDGVVGAVVDFDFDRVAAIVDQEDDRPHAVADHRRDFLGGELERAVADERDDASLGLAQSVAERGSDGPADRAVLHLDFERGAGGQIELACR